MTKAIKQLPATKRAYRKRNNITPPDFHITTSSDSHNWESIIPTNKDTEMESLTAICSILDNYTSEQKTRIIRFLASRYYAYLNAAQL